MHFPFSFGRHNGNVAHPHLRPPPRFVLSIPTNRALQPFFKRESWLTAQQAFHFGSVAGVSKHLTGAVSDKLYPALVRLHHLKHCFRHFENALIRTGADVHDLSCNLIKLNIEQTVKCVAMFLDENPVSLGRAVAVYGERFFENATCNESRNGLFEMLVRTVIVERPYNDDWDIVGGPIRVHQTIRAALGRSIRTHRVQRMLLSHLPCKRRAVNFGRRDVYEALYAVTMFDNSVSDRLRSQDIGFKEEPVVIDRARDVGLSRHVYDNVRL